MKKITLIAMFAALLAGCGQARRNDAAEVSQDKYNSVVYELNIRQATPEGTFAAAERYLPELKKMGVDIVWLMPIHPIGVDGRKGSLGSYYSISDYEAVNPEFGDIESFDRFVAAAHDLGLKVIIDWVANHTSRDAKWWKEGHEDWYVLDEESGLPIVQYDWTDIAKLDYANAEMREAMTSAMLFWIGRGVDGFRCDVAYEVPIDFWQQAFARIRAVAPDVYLLAEGEKTFLHDSAFDTTYGWDLHHLMNAIARGEKSAADLRAYVESDAAAYPAPAMRLMFTSNHDENSWSGSEFERMGDAAATFAALTFVLPQGQPLIYTGQEIGLDRRLEFFEKDTVDGLTDPQCGAGWRELYTDLCRLRHTNAALAAGEDIAPMIYMEGAPEDVMAFTREKDGRAVFCLFNLSAEPQTVVVTDAVAGGYKTLAGGEYALTADSSILLAPWQWMILTR
ncbi:MAG: alpha-amylase family glycosyl hydrolase [Alistipes sp.]|nr:alpha-amylase family glycosyl hydrolase [Alistipes sp.]